LVWPHNRKRAKLNLIKEVIALKHYHFLEPNKK